MMPKILFIGHSYHQLTKSSEFFVEHLNLLGEVTVLSDDCIKGQLLPDYLTISHPYDMVVVWQIPNIISKFAGLNHQKNIIYVPMFDAVYRMDSDFWKSLRYIKVVCFCATLRAICLTHGLDSFYIQHYPEWVGLVPYGYTTKSLFFWQRRASPNWDTVISTLPVSQFEHMHHHVALDPGFEILAEQIIYPDASDIASGHTTSSNWFPDKVELIDKFKQFNLFFLPREREGIGMSFLDAMTTGLIPVGFNHPTYNEYVVDGLNGFIVGRQQQHVLSDLHPIALSMMHYLLKGRKNYLRRLKGLDTFMLRSVKMIEVPKRAFFLRGPKYFRRWTNRYFSGNGEGRRSIKISRPLISIILIVKNDIPGFLVTHESICSQSFDKIEYIVVDRNSTDGTNERIKRHETSIDQLIDGVAISPSEAMKIAVDRAKGRYIIFLNAGSKFAETTSLREALQDAPTDAEIIYGHHYKSRQDGSVKLKLATDLNQLCKSSPDGIAEDTMAFRLPNRQAVLLSSYFLRSSNLAFASGVATFREFLEQACQQSIKTYHSNTVIVWC